MAEAQRIKPNLVVMHHSVGPEFVNANAQTVANWFNTVGKGRGYKNSKHSGHFDPRTGKETFAQAHYALQRYPADKKYGWRLVPLVRDIYGVITWGAGNWQINRRAINIETCGTFTNRTLPEKARMLVANTFRGYDKKIGGILDITCHNFYSATICPGKICGQRQSIIDMINNPAKWNAKLWPKPKPKPPVVKPKPPTKIVKKYVRYGMPHLKVFNKDANLWDFGKTGWSFRVVKRFKKGADFLAVGEAQHSNGGTYLMAGYSFGKADKTGVPVFTNGVNLVDLIPKPVPPPPPKPTPSTTTSSSSSSSSTSSSSTTTLLPPIPVKEVNNLEAIKTFLGDILSRFTSRKFLLSVGTIVGINQADVGDVLGEGIVRALQILVAITYVIVEGYIDAERAKSP